MCQEINYSSNLSTEAIVYGPIGIFRCWCDGKFERVAELKSVLRNLGFVFIFCFEFVDMLHFGTNAR